MILEGIATEGGKTLTSSLIKIGIEGIKSQIASLTQKKGKLKKKKEGLSEVDELKLADLKRFISENKGTEYLEDEAAAYSRNVISTCGSMRILGMSKPVSLETIYVNVNIINKPNKLKSLSVNDHIKMNEDFHSDLIERLQKHDDINKFPKNLSAEPAIKAVNEIKKLQVLGRPGVGKTTMLKYLALMSLYGKLKRRLLPVFVILRDWTDSNYSLDDYIALKLEESGIKEARCLLDCLSAQGKVLYLFDGYDEIQANDESLTYQIKKYTNKYSECNFVLSCRIAANNYVFEQFTDVQIADFTPKQIKYFISNWFSQDKNKAERCLNDITNSDNRPIFELATTPLLATLICIAYQENGSFPPNRAELYKDSLEALLKKWDSTRDIKRPTIYKHLSLRKKEALLAKIARYNFEKSQYLLKKRDVVSMIGNYISNLASKNNDRRHPEGEDVLKPIEAQHGLIVERAVDIYSFSHLTIQEYLTALHILYDKNDSVLSNVVLDYMLDRKWKETFILLSCMLQDGGCLFDRQISFISEKFKKNSIFDDVIFLIDNTVKPESNIPIVSVKNYVFKALLNNSVLIGAKDVASKIEYCVSLIESIDIKLSSIYMYSYETDDLKKCIYLHSRPNVSEKFVQRVTSSFSYPDLLIYISDYLYSIELTLSCLDSDCYASISTKDSVRDMIYACSH